MEKLIELLNEYEKKRIDAVNAKWLPFNIKLSFRPYTERDLTNEAYKSCWLEICSKYYAFIKRLVDNDKIDRSWVEHSCCIKINGKVIHSEHIGKSDLLIMALSIQDNPIEFLVSILK